MQRQGLLTEKQAADIRGGLKRFFKPNPFEEFSYEDIKRFPFDVLDPKQKAFFDAARLQLLRAEPSRFADYKKHLSFLNQVNTDAVARAQKAIKDDLRLQQKAIQQAHVNQATNRMHNLGQDALIASGGVGLGLYGGKKLYDSLHKQSSQMPPTLEEALKIHEADYHHVMSRAPEHLRSDLHELFSLERDDIMKHYGQQKQSSADIAEKVAVVVGGQRLQEAKRLFEHSTNYLDRYLAGEHSLEDLIKFGKKVLTEAERTGAEANPELAPLYQSFRDKFKQAHTHLTNNPPKPKPHSPNSPNSPNSSRSPSRSSSSSSSSSSSDSSPKWPLRTAIGILGAGGLTGAGMLWHHLYKEHEANKMLKESEEQSQLTEEQIQMLRLSALTPEQRALYLQVNPAGVPKMANQNHKEAGIRDFFRGPIGRKSPEFVQGRQAIDVAGKAKREEDYLKSYAKRKGLNVNPTGEIGHAPQPGFFSRNKLPLGLLAAGAGGLYLMNQQQDKLSAYDETLTRLGLGKLAAAMPSKMPPIPFKAKSQAARQGKPFFTPSQAERAKKLEGPAHTKAPWEDMKTAFDRGYYSVLNMLNTDKTAAADRAIAATARAVMPKSKAVIRAADANLPGIPDVSRMPTMVPTGKADTAAARALRSERAAGSQLPSGQADVAAGRSARAAKKSQTPQAAPTAPQSPGLMDIFGGGKARPEGLLSVKQTQKAPLLNRAKGMVGDVANKTQEAWGKMPTWGKGMAAGGAGLGLLGGGMGLGSAMASPPPQPPIVLAH
jgi:hypothetical protein